MVNDEVVLREAVLISAFVEVKYSGVFDVLVALD